MNSRSDRRARQRTSAKKETPAARAKKLDKRAYIILLILFAAYMLHRIFFDVETIGQSIWYNLFTFLLPVISGMLILAWYNKAMLKKEFSEPASIWIKLVLAFFYLAQAFLFSYFSLGLLAHASMSYLNRRAAEESYPEIFQCSITKFHQGQGRGGYPAIHIIFRGKHESVNADNDEISGYLQANPGEYELEITAQEGIWDHYVLNGWRIVPKREIKP
jgi:hypothetical protein